MTRDTLELLRESEQHLLQLGERFFDLLVLTRDGLIVEVKGPLFETLGYRIDEVVGRPSIDFVAPSAIALTKDILSEQRAGVYESAILGADGDIVPVEIFAINTTVLGIPTRIACMRDLRPLVVREEERRQLVEQLTRMARLDELLAHVASLGHDFERLLATIEKSAARLENQSLDGIGRAELEAIAVAARQSQDLTRRLLTHSGEQHGLATNTQKDRPCHVLLVDDEPLVLRQLKRILSKRGYDVTDAASADACLAEVAKQSPDVLILDVSLGERRGPDVVRRLRGEGAQFPIVLVSGQSYTPEELSLDESAFQGFLRKPFGIQELLATIEASRAPR